jgi:hypothetical protein
VYQLTDPNKEWHEMPIDPPKNGITFDFVIFDGFDMRSGSKIKNIAVAFMIFTFELGRDLLGRGQVGVFLVFDLGHDGFLIV